MSDFKDMIAADIDDVFLNLDEFAETHNLNGVECSCVVQSSTARELFLNSSKYTQYEGVQGKLVVVHVAKKSLPEIPGEGQRFDLDGEILIVSSVVDDMGMLTIELHGEEI